ncbi:MAG: aminopeptidase P family protein [Firmicutes bacterium]|nr:aminopeptidase P family protein [Bacillota bacterium]
MNIWARGPMQADFEERIDFNKMRAKRCEKVRQVMEQEGIDALFLWRDENVRYLTSLRVLMLQFRSSTTYGVLITKDAGPILFMSSAEVVRAKEVMPWIEEFYSIPIMDEEGLVERVVVDKVVPLFKKYGIEQGRVGVDCLTFAQRKAFEKFLPNVEWVDGQMPIQRARMKKLPEEVAIIAEATAIADAVTQTAIEAVRPGVRECEVAGEAMRTMYRLGAEFGHTAVPFVASGERMAPPTRFNTDKLIRNGDIVFIDIGAFWNGMFSDIGRTVICGKPHPQQKRVYRTVYEALMKGIEVMRPGTRCSEVANIFKKVAGKYGLENSFIDLFIGHGVGCAPAEPPFLGETQPGAEDTVLEEGMVLAMEPLIWIPDIPGGAGVRIEDLIYISSEGPVVLSRVGYDEKLLD